MLGVCYYPEHWPEQMWADDARRMAELGLKFVRIGEFAWSAVEPKPGEFDWGWLDRAVATLGAAGLKIVMGTPTATPPKWLIDRSPEILPVDERGRRRGFGSRRHYCFSSRIYREESARITTAYAERYGANPAVVGWQTDNEFGCHNTVRSYSPEALHAFRDWLARRYGTVTNLNAAWGNRFWSMEYGSFDEIDLPMGAVTELNPSHRLDFFRFSSDQVASFNADQVAIIRRFSPGRFVTHNFMGAFLDFDHWKLANDLDLASWDSYPLGFTDTAPMISRPGKERYAETGHPDISAFHHDLYRGVGRGKFWVMEQQPGPVNWARWNPSPAPGMVRLWAWEALAHGADVVSFFRWRQAPFAQEQMHAGLNRPDDVLDIGGREAAGVAKDLASDWWQAALAAPRQKAPAAFVFDYESAWIARIQPQGATFDYLTLVFGWYSALRELGVDIDILPPGAPLDGYRVAIVPMLAHVSQSAAEVFAQFDGVSLFGVRTGSKTESFQIPNFLPPGSLQSTLPVRITRVESLRPGVTRSIVWGNRQFSCDTWIEHVEMGEGVEAIAKFEDGQPALIRAQRRHYLAAWPSKELREAALKHLLQLANIATSQLHDDVRIRRRGGLTFAFNFGRDTQIAPAPKGARFVLGSDRIAPHDVAAWS
ncbi:MAG: beta-galactosidase [Alphaproteobacteria bacterium]|nr:beta-galactosidase [Alphaproteobacteria bacterium]